MSCAAKRRIQTKNDFIEYHNRDFLKKNIYNKSFEQIGREFNVSGNAIKKWCKILGLPHKRSDISKYTIEEWEKL